MRKIFLTKCDTCQTVEVVSNTFSLVHEKDCERAVFRAANSSPYPVQCTGTVKFLGKVVIEEEED